MGYSLDIQMLAGLVRSKRGHRGLRVAAQECNTSASTISRVEREQVPDINSFLALCNWLEVAPARLFKDSEHQLPNDELPLSKAEELALRVRSDSRLSPATANVLATLIKAAYRISAETNN
ncbi:MAG: XRE family transcriptional regulator [Cyanobacteria bacterium J06598_1]